MQLFGGMHQELPNAIGADAGIRAVQAAEHQAGQIHLVCQAAGVAVRFAQGARTKPAFDVLRTALRDFGQFHRV
ncbi:hypothetical protein D3C79_1042280 [compost metagenome]